MYLIARVVPKSFDFSSGQLAEELENTFIVKKKILQIPGNVLFSTTRSREYGARRQQLEDKLKLLCSPLTITQRTSCWFTQKSFHLTDTDVSSII